MVNTSRQWRRPNPVLCGLAVVSVLFVAGGLSACSKGTSSLELIMSDPDAGGDGSISPDGRSIALSSRRGGNLDIWLYDTLEKSWTQLTSDPDDEFEPQWAPNGQWIVFTKRHGHNKDLWLISPATKATVQLTNTPYDEEYPSWSPDSTHIVFVGGPWTQRTIFIVPRNGGTPTPVSARAGQPGGCAFTADGLSLLCHIYNNDASDIYRVKIASGEVTQLTDDPDVDYKPTASPRGEWISFSKKSSFASRLWFISQRGRQARMLASENAGDDRWPSWTADGRSVLFHRFTIAGKAVQLLDRRTGLVRNVIGAQYDPQQASLDPTGRHLVFCSGQASGRKMYVMQMPDGQPQPFLASLQDPCFPRWSPNGDEIAFLATVNGSPIVGTARLDGTEVRLFPQTKSAHPMPEQPSWSPDSGALSFSGQTGPFETNVYHLDLSKQRVRQLTDDHWVNREPTWSSDGKSLLYASTRGGEWTWGVFSLALSSGGTAVVSKPSLSTKSSPAMAGDCIVWTETDAITVPHLASADANGRPCEGIGTMSRIARWPSFSQTGRYVLYTVAERRVEFWRLRWSSEAAFLSATRPMRPTERAENGRARDPRRCERPVSLITSPVELDHR